MTGRHTQRSQHGAALLIFLAGLILASLALLVNRLDSGFLDSRRAEITAAALAEAKMALLWHAETFREQQNRIQIEAGNPPPHPVYGYLPLPDLGNGPGGNTNIGCPWEGCDANLSGSALNKTVIGRFPWLALGTGPLRDGHGECLWYAVSGSHQRIEKAIPMNWDTLGQIDIVTTSETDPAKLKLLLASPHARPTAIIFSPGPPLDHQKRGDPDGNDVRICGGNYVPANYLDPELAIVADAGSTYFSGSVDTDTAMKRLAIETQGRLYKNSADNSIRSACKPPENTTCKLVANDAGLPLAPDTAFNAIRKNSYFRQDMNSLLDRMTSCLRDNLALIQDADLPDPTNKTTARIPSSACYDDSVPPVNYFSHYQKTFFVAKPDSGNLSVNGQSCAGVLLQASQRGAKDPAPTDPVESSTQTRSEEAVSGNNDTANSAWLPNYLEGVNLISFTRPTTALPCPPGSDCLSFSGPEFFDRPSALQSAERDIVRCIPATPSFVTVGPTIAGLGQLATYSTATRSLMLGLPVSATQPTSIASSLFGCAWMPETHAMGGGLRSYFMFRINDAGFSSAAAEGISFAIVDGDNNGGDACGAAGQHMGYSGSNPLTPFLVPPKIAFEIDPRREGDFDPDASDTLLNGRNDPTTTASSYRGGHVALAYWGGDLPVATDRTPPCTAPRVASGGICYLPSEEDDNVHGQSVNARNGFPLPPANPAAPAIPLDVPPDAPAGVYKLDPSRSQVPVNRNFHVRIELSRSASASPLPSARVATVAPIDITNPGSAIDGVILFPKDRVLVKDQVAAVENGIYVWQAATIPLTRATDADTGQKLAGSVIEVAQGAANARTLWHQTASAPALGTDAIHWNNLRVKVAVTQADINLANPGARIEGILMQPGDRVLVLNLGIHVWNGAATAMTAATDNFTGAVVQIQQGSSASGLWRFDGSSWSRQSVRVATQGIIDLTSPVNPVDGVTLAGGELVLVKTQGNASQNGIYLWNGAGVPMTVYPGSPLGLTQVLEGTDAGRVFRLTGTHAWSAIDGSPQYKLEAWILPDSSTTTHQIAAMQDTTRPMSFLTPTFTPHLRDTPIIPYPFRNVRLGFTVGQRRTVTDQNFTVSSTFTTWIP